jgi:hypothetical protein
MFLIDQLQGTVKPTGGITYRVGVKNTGTKTLHQVRVRIVAVHPASTEDVFPLTLRKKDDNGPPYTSSLGFSIHPGETEYVDVVMKSDEQDNVQVQHVVSGINRDLLPRNCTLTLTAYGEDIMSTPSAKFDVSIGVDGELELNRSALTR